MSDMAEEELRGTVGTLVKSYSTLERILTLLERDEKALNSNKNTVELKSGNNEKFGMAVTACFCTMFMLLMLTIVGGFVFIHLDDRIDKNHAGVIEKINIDEAYQNNMKEDIQYLKNIIKKDK